MFALAVVGTHAAADRLDDHLFSLLHTLDRLLDFALATLLRGLGGLFSLASGRTEALVESALELVDLDTKLRWSVRLAIGLELVADFLLLFATLGPGTREADHTERRAAGRALYSDPTLLRVASPLAVSLLALAGLLVMGREVHTQALGLFSGWGLGGLGARALTGLLAALALLLGLLLLVPKAWSRPLVRAHRFAVEDRARGLDAKRLRTRGLSSLVVLLPVALVAAREVSRLLLELARALS